MSKDNFRIKKPLFPSVEFEWDGHRFTIAKNLVSGMYFVCIDSRVVAHDLVPPTLE